MGQLFFNCFFDEAVQALLMHDGIYSSTPVYITVLKSDVQAAFIGNFRGGSFLFTYSKIIIYRLMKT